MSILGGIALADYAQAFEYGTLVFDRDPVNHLLRGVLEEAGELAKACRNNSIDGIFEETGDLLFMTLVVGYYYEINLENALEAAKTKILGKAQYEDDEETMS